MNNKKLWNTEETDRLIKLRQAGNATTEIARLMGRSFKSVEQKLHTIGIKCPVKATPPPTTVEQDLEARGEDFWERQYNALNTKYEKLLTQQNAVDRLVSGIQALAPQSYKAEPCKTKARVSTGKPQSAVLELSDTHVGAVVHSNQTLTFGNYNFDVFLNRLKYLEETVISITTNHINTPVPELVVAMLGDMLDGALQHSAECGQVNTIFSQFYGGAHALAQFLRNLAPHFPKIRVYDVVGNHPRYQNQHKMPTKNKFSNFDKFLYALIRSLVRDIPTIEWEFTPQPFQVFNVAGFTFFAGHGENLRGGDKALGIPSHSIGRLVSTTSQLFGKHEMQAPNYYLFGHLHRNISLPHATGDIIINGGFVGVDNYGLNEMFVPADPMQKLFFIHPVYGKTATYDISLKFAESGTKRPYEIPENFPVQ